MTEKDWTDAEQTGAETLAEPEPVYYKIACVGDSLTYGQESSDPAVCSYPAVLQTLLRSEHYEVNNFGHWGRMMSQGHERYYGDTEEYAQSIAYGADIVVLCLGTNDASKLAALDNAAKQNFQKSLISLVSSYRTAGAKAVYVCIPPYHESSGKRLLSDRVIPWLKEVISDEGYLTIDLWEQTDLKPELLASDSLHLNDAGYEVMAQIIGNRILKDFPA